jgi:putative tricarboxylic transport membrane protein
VHDALLALQALMSLDLLALMVVGICIGMIPGILPGIGGAATISLALPFTVHLSELQTLVLLLSLYTGVSFGGSITSILVGIPGGGSSVAVMFDGHRMAKAGMADHALGASLGSVATGHIIGALFLIFLIGPLATVALKFGPSEMLMVISLAILMIGTIRGQSAVKGILTGLFGILVGTIGISPHGDERGTMGTIYLLDGFPAVALLVAMFTIPGIVEMCMVPTVERKEHRGSSARALLAGMGAPLRYPGTAFISSMIGLWIGILPAIGGSVGSLASYNLCRTFSPRGRLFATGTGHEEGIVACETANGSDEGGSLATLLVLGLPGGSTTAAMMGALILQGWAVGPKLVFDHWEVIRTANWSVLFQAILLLPIGFVFCYYGWRIVRVKTTILVPMVSAIMVTGVFAIRGEPLDVVVAVSFGILAWLMQKTDFPPLNFVIGLLLGPILEGELVRTVATFSGRWELLFQRPLFLILLVALLATLALTIRSERNRIVRERQMLARASDPAVSHGVVVPSQPQ